MRILREAAEIYLFNRLGVFTNGKLTILYPYNTHIALNYSVSRLKNKVANVTFGFH